MGDAGSMLARWKCGFHLSPARRREVGSQRLRQDGLRSTVFSKHSVSAVTVDSGGRHSGCAFGPPEIVTSPPQGPDEGSRAVCDGQPASQELDSFTCMRMTGCKNLGSSQQNNIKTEPLSP